MIPQPERVWAAIRDIGVVHTGLLPGRVVDTRLEEDTRIVVFPDDRQVGKLNLECRRGDSAPRLRRRATVRRCQSPITYYHASFQAFAADGHRSRPVWADDVLPHSLAPQV